MPKFKPVHYGGGIRSLCRIRCAKEIVLTFVTLMEENDNGLDGQ